MATNEPHILVRDLTMAFGSFVLQRDLTFTINRGTFSSSWEGAAAGEHTF